MCLRDADGQIAQTVPLEGVELLGGGAAVVDAVGAVHPARHGLDLLAQRGLERVQRPVRRGAFAGRLEPRRARSSAPLPPSATCVVPAALTPHPCAPSSITAPSLGWSVGKPLTAT